MKKIHFEPEVPPQVRAIPQHIAMTILEAIHRYAETGAGRAKPADSRPHFTSTSLQVSIPANRIWTRGRLPFARRASRSLGS